MATGWRKVKKVWCMACDMRPAREVHHIIARVDGGTNAEENLIDLCAPCHKKAPNGIEEIKRFVECKGTEGVIIMASASTAYEVTLGLLQKHIKDKYKEKFIKYFIWGVKNRIKVMKKTYDIRRREARKLQIDTYGKKLFD